MGVKRKTKRRKAEGLAPFISLGQVVIPVSEAELCAQRMFKENGADPRLLDTCEHYSTGHLKCGQKHKCYGYQLESVALRHLTGFKLSQAKLRILQAHDGRGLDLFEFAVLWWQIDYLLPEDSVCILSGSSCGRQFIYIHQASYEERLGIGKIKESETADQNFLLATCSRDVNWSDKAEVI